MRRLLFLILLGAAGAYAVRRFAFEGIYVASESMAPALPTGRHIMVNKMAFLFSKPHRGDIVMFDSPMDPSRGLIKRVIAVEGDRVELRNKEVLVNGVILNEPYVQHTRPNDRLVGDTRAEVTVPSGKIFVMGDNRDVSGDSRDWKNASGEWTPFLSLDFVRGLVQR